MTMKLKTLKRKEEIKMNGTTKRRNHYRKLNEAVVIIITLVIIAVVLALVAFASNTHDDKTVTPTTITPAATSDSPTTEPLKATPKTTIEATTTIEAATTPEPQKRLVSLGEYKLTAYCPCSKCCGKWGENRPIDANGNVIVVTASGQYAKSNWTIAADTSMLPFGTRVYINGFEYEVQDRGGAVKGNKIDIYFDTHQEALNFGVQYAEVFIEVEEVN